MNTQFSKSRERQLLDEEARWRAVLARDANADGTFVLGVRTTGIYCRPSCPARHPRREHVVFFDLPEAAEQAGFRPCRRCRPQQQAASDPGVALVQRSCRFIEENLGDKITLGTLASQEAISKHQLQRIFKRTMGITPRQYAEAYRLGRLKVRLRDGKDVTRALYEVGFGSSSRLYERSNARLGMTPATYRRGGRGMRIHYAIIVCSLGRLLVAATERGICAVHFGNSEVELRAALQGEFPAAELHSDGATLRSWVEVISAHLSGQKLHLDLPLDVRATAFQWRVWEALRAIPYGETRSYSDVARAVGNPKAVRAVAHACASNPVPIVIPCHRVIRSDGSLGGYGGGVERKRALLAQERTKAKSELSLTDPTTEPVNV